MGTASPTVWRSAGLWFWVILAAAALLRVGALASDAYGRLDWSAALLTDEGFYVHNARNVVLYGHARTDEFNSMLLAPVLHGLQTVVFQVFGSGAVQARSISVVCSLLTLAIFSRALRRVFGDRVALTATLFLALDHTNALFNRMALLDTPAALPAAAAFYAFVRGLEDRSSAGVEGVSRKMWLWLAVSGVLLGVTVTNRMLAAYLLPVPFIAVWGSRYRLSRAASVFAGVSIVAAVYLAGWFIPHRKEIAAMNRYYRSNQIQPRSAKHLAENVRQAVVGDHRGMSPYLMRHSPIVYLLASGWMVAIGLRKLRGSKRFDRVDRLDSPVRSGIPASSAAEAYLVGWFGLGWMLLAVISYSPSRYYVTIYPAMAAMASLALWRLADAMQLNTVRVRVFAAGAAAFAAFHATLAVVHYRGVLPAASTNALLWGIPVAISVLIAWRWGSIAACARAHRTRIVPAVVLVWAAINGAWVTDWARNIKYTQVAMSRWLGQNLPAGSVLIGDVAPGVSMDNGFRAIHVQPGLANYRKPVEKYVGAPRYLVLLDGRWKERYWLEQYPELIDPSRRIKLARLLRWDVGIYSVDGHDQRTP